jgi:hypothetical protein
MAKVTPTLLSRTGWKTYTSTNLQVAVDYPPDWSVREAATGATFTSPQGLQIQLAQINTGKLSPEDYVINNEQDLPNTRCTSSTNAYGVKARVCLDTIAFSYAASLIVKSPDGTTRLLSLAMGGKARDPQVLNAMAASVRPSP